jgi:hypothetical protein
MRPTRCSITSQNNHGYSNSFHRSQPERLTITQQFMFLARGIVPLKEPSGRPTPVRDEGAEWVGWFDGKNLFGRTLAWIAFLDHGHLFSSATGAWLGSFQEGSFQDRVGRAVGYLQGHAPKSGVLPTIPRHPDRPLPPPYRPYLPHPARAPIAARPALGWSRLTWQEWIHQDRDPARGRSL